VHRTNSDWRAVGVHSRRIVRTSDTSSAGRVAR
jgi:hypothetical protein